MRWPTRIADDEARVVVVFADSIRDPKLLDAYEELLTPDERARRDRYRFEKDRHSSLVTRALVRTMLSRYAPEVDPRDWRFVANHYGRPEVDEPRHARFLRFNLSHTRGMVACIVSRDREVGIDVEARDRGGRLLEVADRFFAPSEVEALRSLPEEQQLERFFVYWTLKESYIKARGMGLAIPLSQFSFVVDSGIRIDFDPRLEDDPRRWQFTALSFGRRHALAASVTHREGEFVRIEVEEQVPLQEGGSGPGRISRR